LFTTFFAFMRSGRTLPLLLAAAVSACAGNGVDPDGAAWPQRPLGAADAAHVDPRQFLPAKQLRAWGADLDQRGMRATGSPAEQAYLDALYQRLAAAGVKQLRYEQVPLARWSVDRWSLDIVGGPAAGSVITASYIPYSGITSESGVTAPLVYLAPGTAPGAAQLAGKIVLFDVATQTIPMQFFLAKELAANDPRHLITPQTPYSRPHLAIPAVLLDQLAAAGAAGVIGVLDEPAETAHGTHFPYDRKIRVTPGVYVDKVAGARLKGLADGKTLARIALPATVTQMETRNLIGIIPGASDELTVVNSHTDGTNGIEDNGPNAIVAMAQYLTRLPQQALPRTVMILLTSGHFASGVGADEFMRRHAEDGVLPRIASILTLEHLGAEEWLPDAHGVLAPTGRHEFSAIFTPRISPLVEAAANMLKQAEVEPGYVFAPLFPNATSGPVWPGEGQYFWAGARLPTANFITGPSYLLNWGVSTVDKTDFELMRRESIASTQMLLDLSRVPFGQLRQAAP